MGGPEEALANRIPLFRLCPLKLEAGRVPANLPLRPINPVQAVARQGVLGGQGRMIEVRLGVDHAQPFHHRA